MYSQNNEEAVILDYFKDKPKGVLLDLGTANGVKFSNSRELILQGWEANLVEANPIMLAQLIELYEMNPLVTIHDLMIFPDDTEPMDFYIGNSQVSSTNESIMQPHGGVRTTIQKPGTSLESLWEEFQITDFVSMDLDGINFRVLNASVDLFRYIPLICIEHESRQEEIKGLLIWHEAIYESAENLILARTDA